MDLSPPLIQFFESLYASVFFATIMTTALYGITCMQLIYYYVHYQDDPLRIKLLVAVLWGLDTIHEALTISGAYKIILAALLNPLSLLDAIPEFVIQLLTTVPALFFCLMNSGIHTIQALAAVLAQGYFVYRLYIVTEKKIVLPLIWAILGCYQLGGIIFYLGKALYFSHGLQVVSVTTLNTSKFFTIIATSTLSIAAGVDIMIAISLTYLLLRKRTAASFSSTAHILQRLILFSVNTGSWTALFALLALILMHIYPTNLIDTVFSTPLCSVYCNTVLANLNARQYIRGEMENDADIEQTMESRGIVIMMSTDRQTEHKQSISTAPLGQRNTMSFPDEIRRPSETSENAV